MSDTIQTDVPQAAVDAVLGEWERRYFNGEEEYKPDPSHRAVVRDALTVAESRIRAAERQRLAAWLHAEAEKTRHDPEAAATGPLVAATVHKVADLIESEDQT